MGVGRIFQGGGTRNFSKVFPGGAKVVKCFFSYSKLRKQPFFWTFQNPGEKAHKKGGDNIKGGDF